METACFLVLNYVKLWCRMGYRDKRYGVTWISENVETPTTVWFTTPANRKAFIKNLLTNKLVLKDSIFISNKNVDENEK